MDDAFRLISDLLGSEQRAMAAEKRADFLAERLDDAQHQAVQRSREASHDAALHTHEVHTLEKKVVALVWAKQEAVDTLHRFADEALAISEQGIIKTEDWRTADGELARTDRAKALHNDAVELAEKLEAEDWVVRAVEPDDAGAGWEVFHPDDIPEGREVDDERE